LGNESNGSRFEIALRLLLLGGGRFVGRALVDAALLAGWRITVLNIDSIHHYAAAGVEHLIADRHQSEAVAAAIRGRSWDLVVDTWQWDAAAVSNTARLVQDSAGVYCYVSSVSVYTDKASGLVTEDSPILAAAAPGRASYPQCKAAAERAVAAAFGARALIVRPGLLVGLREYPGRLPWWLLRARDVPDMLCPVEAFALQWADVRDLAEWIIAAGGAGLGGCYNFAGPRGVLSMRAFVEACHTISGSAARLHQIGESALLAAGVRPWTELPLWLPRGFRLATVYQIDASKALRAGARFRPAVETIDDTWRWLRQLAPEALAVSLDSRAWLSRVREERILAAYSGK
jgi:2'-hydroxyisoflavone reductase